MRAMIDGLTLLSVLLLAMAAFSWAFYGDAQPLILAGGLIAGAAALGLSILLSFARSSRDKDESSGWAVAKLFIKPLVKLGLLALVNMFI